MAGTIGQFKSDHHTIFGLALITVGVFGVIGSLTGNLAVMLAALFDPSALSVGSNGGTNAPLIPPKAPSDPTEPETPEDPLPDPPGLPEIPGLPELPALPLP